MVLTVFKQSFVTTLTVGVHYIHGLAEHEDCNLSMNCSDKLIFGPKCEIGKMFSIRGWASHFVLIVKTDHR